jgi:hypothetical protein
MSLSTPLIISAALAAWLLVLALVWIYCMSAAREERRIEGSRRGMDRVPASEGADETTVARS